MKLASEGSSAMIRYFIPAALLLALVVASCSFIPGRGDGSVLKFDGATEQTIGMGETIPGSNIRFVGYSDLGAEVMIDDQKAIKKQGDSLDWEATLAPGVDVSMPLRIILADEARLKTVGTVHVTISNANPQPATVPPGAAYSYKVAMGHAVRKGDRIPGTTITFRGKSDEGAQLEGVDGYPYRRIGDSVTWAGRLNNHAFMETTMRVAAYTEDLLTLAGLAEITVAP